MHSCLKAAHMQTEAIEEKNEKEEIASDNRHFVNGHERSEKHINIMAFESKMHQR